MIFSFIRSFDKASFDFQLKGKAERCVSLLLLHDVAVPNLQPKSSMQQASNTVLNLQLFLLKTSAAGIGPFNRKWRGFFEQGNE